MGQAVLDAAASQQGIQVTAALVGAGSASLYKASHGLTYTSDLVPALAGADGTRRL